MSEHEQPWEPAEQTEHENQQYPDHGRPDRNRDRVGLPEEGDERRPEEREGE
jgi:hypothetical protein